MGLKFKGSKGQKIKELIKGFRRIKNIQNAVQLSNDELKSNQSQTIKTKLSKLGTEQ